MALGNRRSWRTALCVLTGASLLAACSDGEMPKTKSKRTAFDPIGYEQESVLPLEPDSINEDSGAFGPKQPTADASTGNADDGSAKAFDGGVPEKVYCESPLSTGDLVIVELMIASKSGAGDTGEWVEIQSTRDCWLNVKGVSVESPRGSSEPDRATIHDDFELTPHGTFVVANSLDPAKNHGVTGKVIAWEISDVLKNDGDTVTVKLDGLEIDSLTYPARVDLTPGSALAFPSDCALSDRLAWDRWSFAPSEYSAGYNGTPNAGNTDVSCPTGLR